MYQRPTAATEKLNNYFSSALTAHPTSSLPHAVDTRRCTTSISFVRYAFCSEQMQSVCVCVVIAARHSQCSCFRFHCACRAKLEQQSVRFTRNTADTNPIEFSEMACARRDNAPNYWNCMFAASNSTSCRILHGKLPSKFPRC